MMKRLICGVLVWMGVSWAVVAGAEDRPNVLFIAIDDLNDWVGPLGGHPQALTPSMDGLAARGTVFTNAHCQAPLCNASRTSLMLGLRPSTTGIYGLAPWFREVEEFKDRVTLAQHFARHGYRTLSGGKIFHGGKRGREDEFAEWGPDASVGARPEKKLVDTPSPHPLVDWGTFPHRDEDKGDWEVASWAVETLHTEAEREDPFFLAVGFFLPHVPCYASQAWFDLYPDDRLELPAFLEGDRLDIPAFASYLHWDLPETRLSWLRQHNEWRSLVRAYLASVSFVDSQVGRVLEALEATGQADNTVVVLWSDHGWHLGEKGITGKNTLWAESTRVPLLFAGPGIAPGARCSRPAELLDLYPTLSEVCGLPAPEAIEGLSLLPQLKDARAPRERPAITTHNHDNHGVCDEKWRYIRYADGSEELYDLENDPNEWTNLAAREGYEEVKAKLAAYLPEESASPAEGSRHRILTFDGAKAVWEGAEIAGDESRLPGDVPMTDSKAAIFPEGAAAVELLNEGAGEGPAWHPRLGLFFSGAGGIQRLTPGGTLEMYKADAGSNGLLFDGEGRLVVCEPKNRRVRRLNLEDDTWDLLAETYEGKRLATPNDVAVDSRGRIYFTDPRYGSRDDLEIVDEAGRPVEGVYRVDPGGEVTRIITHEVDRPNGILVSPDDAYLYVADNQNDAEGGARKLWRFTLDEAGTVVEGSRKLIYDWGRTRGPDGMAQDRLGRLYVAAGIHRSRPPVEVAEGSTAGVYVLSPEGALLDFVSVPHDEVTNCTFGGADWKTLYITAGGHLWSIRTTTAGHTPLGSAGEKTGEVGSAKRPVVRYSRFFNAEGEDRYLPEGSYRDILSKLGGSMEVRVDGEEPTEGSLADVDVLWISNPSAEAVEGHPAPPGFSYEMVAVLRAFVYGGGGLVIMGNQEDHNLEVEGTNRLLGHFGLRWVERYTDAKALRFPLDLPVLGGLTWGYYTGNLIEVASHHPAAPRCLVMNDLEQKPLAGNRDEAGCLLATAEPGNGRVVVVTDAGWVNNSVLAGEGLGGVVIKDHDNEEIFRRLLRWAAGEEP